MHSWIITFFFGVCTLAFCSELPSLYWLLVFPPVFFVWVATSTQPLQAIISLQKKIYKIYPAFKNIAEITHKVVTHVFVFVVGFCWVLLYTQWISAWKLPSELESKNLLVTGYIASLPTIKPHHISFEFKTDTVAKVKQSTKLRLSWYGKYPEQLAPGDKWQFLVRLKRPHATLNPGGFDLEKHLLVRHIRATGYVVASDYNHLLDSHWYYYPLTKLRQYLLAKIENVLRFDSLLSIVVALTIGVTNQITKIQWEVLRNTGTSYLVAISGLHIGLIASVILVLVQFLWRRIGGLVLFLPAREAGVVAGLFMGVLYAAVSGFSVPAQRALVMLIVFSLATLLRRQTQLWNAWLWSLFLVVVINPLAELTIGFWLSFIAVAAILYVSGWRIRQAETHWTKFWRMQLTVTVALLPLTLFFFQQFSLTTLGANLIAMPGVCLVVVPLNLLGTLCLLFSSYFGGWVLWLSAKILHLIWWWLSFLSQFSGNSWYHPVYNLWVLVGASIGVLLLFAPRGFPAKYLSLVWLAPLFFYTPAKPKDSEVWFTLLDVGQGLAAVVQTANHVLLYDTGPKFLEHDMGATTVVPYLRQQGIHTIDTMLVSHGDADHIGGADSVLKALTVKNILTSVPKKFAPFVATVCFANQNWQWDGVDFQILSPPKNTQLVGNEASCVLKITQGVNSVLLTGDIERRAEKLLVKSYGADLKTTILVAPHHGSATSSTKDFVAAVAPNYVLFPAGYKNRFRFPNKKVVARYEKIGTEMLNASQEGAITFKFADKSDIISQISYRKKEKRFWNNL